VTARSTVWFCCRSLTEIVDVCCECCVLSGRSLCDDLITRPEESYRLWCSVVCDLETLWMTSPWPNGGLSRQKQTKIWLLLSGSFPHNPPHNWSIYHSIGRSFIFPVDRSSFIIIGQRVNDCFHPPPSLNVSPMKFVFATHSATNFQWYKHSRCRLFGYEILLHGNSFIFDSRLYESSSEVLGERTSAVFRLTELIEKNADLIS